MGDKVYVVSAGDYSAYHIVAIFTSEEDAERLAEVRNRGVVHYGETHEVEEFPLLDHLPEPKVTYVVDLVREGDTAKMRERTEVNFPWDGAPDPPIRPEVKAEPAWLHQKRWSIRGADKDEVLKVARDRLAQMSAEVNGL